MKIKFLLSWKISCRRKISRLCVENRDAQITIFFHSFVSLKSIVHHLHISNHTKTLWDLTIKIHNRHLELLIFSLSEIVKLHNIDDKMQGLLTCSKGASSARVPFLHVKINEEIAGFDKWSPIDVYIFFFGVSSNLTQTQLINSIVAYFRFCLFSWIWKIKSFEYVYKNSTTSFMPKIRVLTFESVNFSTNTLVLYFEQETDSLHDETKRSGEWFIGDLNATCD